MPNLPGITVVHPENEPEREPNLQSQVGRSRRSTTSPSQRKPRSVEGHDQIGYDLPRPTAEDWKNQEPKIIARYYAQIYLDFFGIVDDYLNQANLAASLYRSSSLSYRRWRFWTIIATGMLAAINVCAALELLNITLWGGIKLSVLLNAVAALYAASLTVAGNVESFFNRGEQAAGFRETRDLLLSRYREYCADWVYYVEAYGKTPTACMNAGRLYRQLVDSDQELRRKLKQLTEVRGKEKAKSSTTG
jgi:hypothetical protein